MATSKSFKPQTLRGILYFVLSIIIIGGAGLFYLGLQDIKEYATQVNHTIEDAEASQTQVQALQGLKGQIAQSEQLISKANQMFATPQNYQSQAIGDINAYASVSGVVVSQTSFDPDTPGPTRTMTISLQSPVSYTGLVRFLDSIEGNLPKMQVSDIRLSHAPGRGADVVNVEDIKLTIAVR